MHSYFREEEIEVCSDPRDYFDTRPGILRTFTEAAHAVAGMKWPSKSEGKTKVYVLWARNDPSKGAGYIEWQLNRHEPGILNYDEEARLQRFPIVGLARFVDEIILKPETAGFVAMDDQALNVLRAREDMNLDYLNFFVGVKKV